MYDSVLRLPLHAGANTVDFADGVAVVRKVVGEVMLSANQAVATIELANQKREVVVVTSRKGKGNHHPHHWRLLHTVTALHALPRRAN